MRFIFGDTINLSLIRDNNLLNINYVVSNTKYIGIDSVILPFEQYKYIVIGGIVIMELTDNHIMTLKEEDMPEHNKIHLKIASKNKLEKTFFISKILTGSAIKSLENIYSGNIIKTINNVVINSFSDIIKAINNNIDGHLIM